MINEKTSLLNNTSHPRLDLNYEQALAVKTIEGPLLVLAGAGTGKTRVLTSRLANIIQNQYATPYQTLTVTFTNKAANEMKKRVELLSGYSSGGWWLGTFHSIGARILRTNAQLVGLKSNFTIIDTDDQIRLLKQAMSLENIDEKRWPAKTLLGIIQRWKDRGLEPENADSRGSEFANNQAKAIYNTYQNRLLSLNAADFGDLLMLNLKLFKIAPDVLEKYQSQFHYILVDEYQDTNVSQYLWLRLLAGKNKNICVVGDDDQSIYSWRGAEVGNILRFEKDFNNAKIIRLEKNYRSTGNILESAHGLISYNKSRLKKQLTTTKEQGELINLCTVQDGREEARFISDEIETLKKDISQNNSIAILVRAGFQTRSFEERFLKIGMTYQVVGGLRFYERLEIRDAIAYLRLVNQSSDDLAFERIINKPKRGIGEINLQRISIHARNRNISLEKSSFELIDTEDLNSQARREIKLFLNKLDAWRQRKESLSLEELVQQILDDSGYTEMLQNDRSPDAPGRLENLKELISAIRDFDSLSEFLEHIQLVIDNDSKDYNEAIKIMTLHSAKGLEFDYVFLPGWEEEIFPNKRNIDEFGIKGLEEERRLAYVGLTRAKKKVWLSSANNRLIHGQWIGCFPSRFIQEIPKENTINVNNVDSFYYEENSHNTYQPRKHIRQRKSGYSQEPHLDLSNKFKDIDSKTNNIATGERVFHQKYGYGIVTSIEDEKLEINFEKAGQKKVFLSFVVKADKV